MPDNTSDRGPQDRNRVSGSQDWEVEHLMEKLGVTRKEVYDAILVAGSKREEVENYLKRKKADKRV